MDEELAQILGNDSGGYDPVSDFEGYLNELIGEPIHSPQKHISFLDAHSAHGGIGGGPRPDYTPDENGYIHGRAATFATQSDLNNYARTGSLATGDNGVGAFGHNTAVLPGVAIARDVLQRVYGSTSAANGKTVQVVSPNGTVATLPILDVGPASRAAHNSAVIELTPAATRVLGSGDMGGYSYKFNL